MRKGLRKLVAIVLTATMALTIGAPAFAAETPAESGEVLNTVIVDLPKENVTNETSSAITRAGDTEYKKELVETKSFTKKYIGVAAGQPSNGTVFSSPGGFYWSDGGNNVDVSFAMTAGVVSLGISAGKTGTTGQYISSPYVNRACKLHIYKDVTVYKHAIYKRISSGSAWTLDSYVYTTDETRAYLEVRAV